MTDMNYTDLTLIVDGSGSMLNVKNETVGAINNFISDQKKADGKCVVTLIVFDNQYKVVLDAVPIQEVQTLTENDLFLGGMTAYLDAIGKGISVAGTRFSVMQEYQKPGKVLFVTLTDGHENSSKEFNKQQIKEMITTQEDKYSWNFVFLGADFDAVSQGASLGAMSGNTTNFSKESLVRSYTQLSDNVASYRGDNKVKCASLAKGVGDSK